MTLPLYLLIALQLADVASTFAGFKAGLREANPILVMLGKVFGIRKAIIGAKTAVIALLLYAMSQDWLVGEDGLVLLLCALYAFVVARNVHLIREAKRKAAP